MRFTKMLGICVIAALATMAVAGAGTASATTLCKTSEDPCGAANRYPSATKLGTELASGSKFVLSAKGAAILECSKSTMEGTTSAVSGSPLPLQIKGFTLGLCFGACTKFGGVTPWESSLEGSGGGAATLNMNGVTFQLSGCSFGLKCSYAGNVKAAVSGSPPQVAIENAPLGLTEGMPLFCGNEATISGTYTTTSPSPLFIAQGP